jgi:hypothetical protein
MLSHGRGKGADKAKTYGYNPLITHFSLYYSGLLHPAFSLPIITLPLSDQTERAEA